MRHTADAPASITVSVLGTQAKAFRMRERQTLKNIDMPADVHFALNCRRIDVKNLHKKGQPFMNTANAPE